MCRLHRPTCSPGECISFLIFWFFHCLQSLRSAIPQACGIICFWSWPHLFLWVPSNSGYCHSVIPGSSLLCLMLFSPNTQRLQRTTVSEQVWNGFLLLCHTWGDHVCDRTTLQTAPKSFLLSQGNKSILESFLSLCYRTRGEA